MKMFKMNVMKEVWGGRGRGRASSASDTDFVFQENDFNHMIVQNEKKIYIKKSTGYPLSAEIRGKMDEERKKDHFPY